MKTDRFLKLLLVLSNLSLAAAFIWQWTRPAPAQVVRVATPNPAVPTVSIPAAAPPVVNVDVKELSTALNRIEGGISRLGNDVKMLNVTQIQFTHLGRELDELEKTSVLVATRIREVESLPTQTRKLEATKAILKLREVSKEIEAKMLERKTMMAKIVVKLEERFGEKAQGGTDLTGGAPSVARREAPAPAINPSSVSPRQEQESEPKLDQKTPKKPDQKR